jgi:hypothetical protein
MGRKMAVRAREKLFEDSLRKFKGQWVVIKNHRVIASGKTALIAFNKVKNKKNIHLLKKVPREINSDFII